MTPKVKKAKNSARSKFKIGEKILCYEGAHLYDGKCLDEKIEEQGHSYLIHFDKWNSKYDRWVSEKILLKYNEKNIQRQQELRQKKSKNTSKSSDENETSDKKLKKSKATIALKSNTSESSTISAAACSLKNLTTPSFVCKKDDFLNTQEVKIRIPEDLKQILVDDWGQITCQDKLLCLPTKFNIDKILSDYFIQKTQSSKLPLNHTIEGYKNYLSNLRKYFNFLLEKQLLYPMEQVQLSYFKDNYDSLVLDLKTDENINSQKESRRAWKKYRKSNSKKQTIDKLQVKPEDTGENTNCSEKACTSVSLDNNSQSETSDSSTSCENVSNKELSNKEHIASQSNIEVKKEDENDNNKIDFTKLYGANHLLRLFSKLGNYLFYTDLNEERLALLNSYIYDFLKYLSKNISTYSSDLDSDYIERNQFIMSIQK